MNELPCFLFSVCRERENRTPINGFGDHYSTIKLFPFTIKGISNALYMNNL